MNGLTTGQKILVQQRQIASLAGARPALGGFPGATSVSTMPGPEVASGSACGTGIQVDGEQFALPLSLTIAAATTTVAGTSSGNFISTVANPIQITTNSRIPNDFVARESILYVSTGLGAAMTETLAGLQNWVIVEKIAGVEQSQMPLSKYGLVYNTAGTGTNGGGSSTEILSPEGISYERVYNPTVNYSLELTPSVAITTVTAITFCLVLYGSRGGRAAGPFTSMNG